ncbi:RHS repeat-associated core domain [Alcanivorax sp. S71-1-4]|nr:RHS repeat-associated core domain [Alcanivorax sp. S71-1-4]
MLVRGDYWADGSVYRTEGESFQEIRYQRTSAEADQGTFVVYGKNGDITKYGSDADTRISGDINGGVTGKWALSSVEDRLGYGYRITYLPNTGGEFPERIYYTLKPEVGGYGYASVELAYESDQYGMTSAVLGRTYQAGLRLARITNRMNGAVAKQYFLNYEISTVTKRSLLAEIVECGIGSECLQPTTFSWEKTTSHNFSDAVYMKFPGAPTTVNAFQEGIYVPRFNGWVDINRDRFDDYCRISPTQDFDHSPVEVVCYISDGAGNFTSQINVPTDLAGWRFIYNSNTSSYYNWNVDPSWIDIDNDGYVDLCYSRPLASNDKLECILNQSEEGRFSKVISYEIPRAMSDKFKVGGRIWVDINGDSLADYCYDYVSGSKYYVRCAIQKPGFEFEENIFTKQVSEAGGSWSDVNGDGLPDYCIAASSKVTCHINDRGQNINYAVWEKTGQNFKSDEPSGHVYPGSTTRWFNAGFFDFTGNGYPDYCRIYKTARNGMHGYEAACLESLGTGWGEDIVSTFMPLTPVVAGGVSEDLLAEAVQFMDINNDGKIDWCIERGYAKQWHGADIKCFLGTSSGFGTAITNYTLPDLGVNQTGLRGLREVNRGWADIYGDGEPRYCALYWKSNTPHNRGMACYGPQNSQRQDLLSSVENGQGLYYGVEYKDVSDASVYDYDAEVGPEGQIYLSSGMTVVAKFMASNGVGGLSEQSYFYKNYGYMPDERGGLGFDYERVISEEGKKRYEAWFSHEVNRHQAGQLLRAETAYQVSPGNFRVVSEEEYDWKTTIYWLDGFMIHPLTDTIWNKNLLALRYTVWLLGSTSRKYELDGTLISTTVTENENDAYGNLASQTITTSGQNQSFTKTLTNTYQNYPERWVLGRLTRSEVTQAASYNGLTSAPITRTSAWEYYSPSMPGIGGMLHKEIIEPDNPALRTEKHYTYNQFGAKSSVTAIYPGLPNQTVSYTYDHQGRFVLQEENALGHTMSYGYDLATGNKLSQTDANGLTAYWDYDAIGRPKTEISASGQRSQTRIGGCNTGCPALARYYTESWLESSTGARITESSIEYVDVLGRTIEAHSPGFSGETIIVRTQYDDKGEVTRSSEPFVYGMPTYWSTVVSRDVLGRTLEETTASGVQFLTEYHAYAVEQTANWSDPVSSSQISQTSVVVSDVNGNMRSATDAAQRTIIYHYDAYENLTRIDLPDQVQVENTYDVLGRRLTSSDPNIGNWQYAYDGAGRIALQENGSGRRVCFAYDQIGRMVARVDDYLASSSWSAAKASALNQCAGQAATTSWSYDQPAKGVGRLALLQDINGYSEEPFYDAFGRVLSVDIEYDGLALTSGSVYDGATGRLTQETVLHEVGGPSVTVEYRYNSGGHLYEIGKPGLADYYWRVTDKDARGQVTERSLANGMIQGRAEYDAASGFLQAMRAKVAYTSEWAIQNQTYAYDARGLMRQRAEQIASLNQHIQETFSYDNSNRLTNASIVNVNVPAASYNQSATYDVSGNILNRNDVGSYVYGEACEVNGQAYTPGPHAVTSVTGARNASYCYDGGGNMVSGDGRTISYTSFNKPDQIQTSSASVQLIYGPSRSILKTVTASGTESTTKYSFGAYEKIVKTEQGQSSVKERFSLPGGAVVSFEDGVEGSKKEEYLVSDAIGSVIATVNALGGVSERYQYDPWGRPRASINWEAITDLTWNQIDRSDAATSRGFSGHEMLDKVGLIHMGGRVYDPTIGRFLSADPIVKGLENTESYNRYSYVLNSPLSFTDPSGYSWLSKTWKKLKRSINKHLRSILLVIAPPIALAEASIRYGGKALARFAAKNKFAGEVIGLVGLGACTALTMGSATGACVIGYQAITSGSMTYASGGSLSDALSAGLKSGALAYINIAAANKIASWNIGSEIASGGAHAIRGGFMARISGGDVKSGIVGGFTEGALGRYISEVTQKNRGTGVALAGFVSGTVSEITGGKFAVGASTGAMGYLFNQMSEAKAESRTLSSHFPGVEAGHNAAQYYSDRLVASGGGFLDDPLASIGLGLSVLWTDQTAASTAFTLGTAGFGSLLQGLKGLGNATGSIIFRSGHYASRLEAVGLNLSRTQSIVGGEVRMMRQSLTPGAGFGGRMHIDGILIEYRAMPMPSGSVNIGTIFPVK